MNIYITSEDIDIFLGKSSISSDVIVILTLWLSLKVKIEHIMLEVDVRQPKRGSHNLAFQIINLLTRIITYQWRYNLQYSY